MKILITFFACLNFINSAISQVVTETDTLLANKYYTLGDSLLMAAQYDSAVFSFNKSAEEYKKANQLEKYFDTLIEISKCYRNSADYETARITIRKIQKEVREKLGAENETYPWSLIEAGNLMKYMGRYDSALMFYQNALVIQKKVLSQKHVHLGKTMANIGVAYLDIGKLDSALSYLRNGVRIISDDFKRDHPDLGKLMSIMGQIHLNNESYDSALLYSLDALKKMRTQNGDLHINIGMVSNNIGLIFYEVGKYELSLEYYHKALRIFKNLLGDKHPHIASVLGNIGGVYSVQGNFKSSLEYQEKCLAILQEKFGEEHEYVGISYGNIADIYKFTGNYQLSIEYNKKALKVIRALMRPNYLYIATLYNSIGLSYADLTLYKDAMDYFSKSLSILKKQVKDSNIELAKYHRNIASVQISTRQFDDAIENLKIGLSIYQEFLGERHPDISNIFRKLGSIYLRKHDYRSASFFYQKSLIANTTSFSDTSIYAQPKFEISLNQYFLLTSLYDKAIVLERMYNEEKINAEMVLSYNTLQLCDSLINTLRNKHRDYQDQIILSRTASQIYESAIRVGFELYKRTNDQKYLDHVFYFTEKNKSEVLTNSIDDISAKKLSLLPDSLLDFEQNIKIEQTYYESQLVQQKSQKNGYDTVKFSYNKNRLFRLNRKHDSLILALEQSYPRYHQLKYKNNTIDLEELQQKIDKNTALIEYFEGDSSIYILTITKNDFIVSSIEDQATMNENIDKFRKVTELWREAQQTDASYLKYVSSAYELYKSLIKSNIDSLSKNQEIENLIIIPDGKLSYLPFELLIKGDTSGITGDYTSLDYLIKDYNISYGYSASLLYQNNSVSNRKKPESRYLGFAPSYKNSLSDSAQSLALGKFRNTVTSLEWNQNEVEAASNYMQGDRRLALNATETSFKKEVGDYNILHLAMHALIDDEDPMLSKLVFAQNELDTLNDGYLHTYELFNMEMNPELVVLSACNTGYGKLQKGEGINSLAYAFAYAGCPSIVMSQWQVDDKSTSQLMTHFYKNISAGMDKSSALRNAKLEFLKDPSSPYSNPSYWGGFVLMGDIEPIEFKDGRYIWVMVFSLLVLLLIASFYLKYLERKN